ncbi:MAG: hypothetical protein ACE5GS_09640 [Kiloniellaceae bacterium]
MRARATPEFWDCFDKLPLEIQGRARKAFELWQANYLHPSLHFKRVKAREPVFSIRVSRGWRALGMLEDDTLVWFWIGSHSDYDHLIARL